MTFENVAEAAAERQEICARIRRMIVDRLDLPVDPDWITDDQPLFGRGLELDSVDTLEIVLGIEAEFDILLTDDDKAAFGSVGRLAETILQGEPQLLSAAASA